MSLFRYTDFLYLGQSETMVLEDKREDARPQVITIGTETPVRLVHNGNILDARFVVTGVGAQAIHLATGDGGEFSLWLECSEEVRRSPGRTPLVVSACTDPIFDYGHIVHIEIDAPMLIVTYRYREKDNPFRKESK